ncbi:AbiEi antitoxin C-terminal domain-containing protein [Salinibacterium sp. NYA9b]
MTPRLPPVLSAIDLPLAELQCAALDGELFALDQCFCPIDEFDTIHLRARALGVVLDARIIAERMTAAWVWGAALNPPARHQLCVAIGARTRPHPSLNAVLREVVITDDDIDTVSGVSVTSRLRTVFDLVRFSDPFGAREEAAVRVLMAEGKLDYGQCVDSLNARRNLPQKRIALARLAALQSPAALTSAS